MGSASNTLSGRLGIRRTFIPSFNDGADAGRGFGDGDDFLSPKDIGGITTGFTGGVNPIETRNPFLLGQQDIFSHNASADMILRSSADFIGSVRSPRPSSPVYSPGNPYTRNAPPGEILLVTNDFVFGIPQQSSNNPYGLVRLPGEPFPFIQPVPDLGRNPHPLTILSGSTQVQNDLLTIGSRAIPGFPIVEFPKNPSALDFMGVSEAFIDAIAPYHPRSTGRGALYPTSQPGLFLQYLPPAIQPPYPPLSPFSPTDYPHFAPYFGPPHVVPNQIPYPASYVPPVAHSFPTSGSLDVSKLIGLIKSSPKQLPDYIPFSGQPQRVVPFVKDFQNFAEAKRIEIRETLSNPTKVDMDLLQWTGINTSGGGKYDMGRVRNPFRFDKFLQDTNPFETYQTGMVVTNGNGNGKIKGTPVNDLLIGTHNRNNIIDGEGGEDDITGSTRLDLVNAHQGDRIFTDKSDDVIFFDFTEPLVKNCRLTTIDGGEGRDILVLTINGNPTNDGNQPQFRRLENGVTRIVHSNRELQVKGIERIIVIDKSGNIGAQYDVNKLN